MKPFHDREMNETLTASFFESGAMPALTKSWNTTTLGQEGSTSTQWSHTARTYLKLPLWQWGACNVYLLVLSS